MEYDNYYSDFGLRCFALLKSAKGAIKKKKLDVTARLCVMSAALTIPHEVLTPVKSRAGQQSKHPSGTTLEHPKAANSYEKKLAEDFTASLGAGGLWYMGTEELLWAEKWPTSLNQSHFDLRLKPSAKVEDVLTILRNALAHGNIGTHEEKKIIKQIMFFSVCDIKDLKKGGPGRKKGESVRFNYLRTTVTDFALFTEKWKKFLEQLKTLDS